MSALVLRLGAPAQSWGGHSIFHDLHPTEVAPTRSALLGLLAASLGFERGEWADWLFDTTFTFRRDRSGVVRKDYHTISKMPEHLRAPLERRRQIITGKPVAGKGSLNYIMTGENKTWLIGDTSVSEREFLSDAEFIITVEHPDRLDEIAAAVRRPHFATYLGRKMFPPTFPFYLGVHEGDAHEVLSAIPALAPVPEQVLSEIVEITGDRSYGGDKVTVPAVPDREGQLAWAKENLVR